MDDRHDRQHNIVRVTDLSFYVHVLGAGGIGSWTVLTLAKMGCKNIVVYDDDVVENHNVASQFFKEEQLGMTKVEALQANVLEQTGVEIETEANKVEESIKKGLVIIAIDSMSERIRLGELYKDRDMFIIDGRMGGLELEIYFKDAKNYLATTVAPDEVLEEPCTGRSINFNCLMIAGLIANLVRQYAKKVIKEGEIGYNFVDNLFTRDIEKNEFFKTTNDDAEESPVQAD